MLTFRPKGSGTNLALALAYAAKLLRHRSIVVVLSDFRAKGWEDQMRRLARRHEVVAITVDDARERAIPDAGWIELEDAEDRTRVLVDTSAVSARVKLQIAAEEMRMSRARILERSRVDHIVLHTDQPYAHVLLKAFARRARRLRR